MLLAVGVLLAIGTTALRAQSALDGFDPNANGAVLAVVVQPDGRILLGGDFTTLAPNGGAMVTRNRIARLNPDGTLDTAFNPNATGSVTAIALQADGKILVGGAFNGASSIGGQARNRIARLDPTTGAADAFNPNANGSVNAMAVQTDGRILVGGAFSGASSIGGQTRNRLARLDPATGLADSFDPNASAAVLALTLQANGQILAGGDFISLSPNGGSAVTRNRIARLNPDGSLDLAFNPGATGSVRTIALQADGKVLAGGDFTGANSIGGQTRNRIARLNSTTGAADAFDPNASGSVRSLVVQPDGRILVGGAFNGASSIGGQARNRIARLNPGTGLADSFNPTANINSVLAIAVQADGKVLAGGDFTSLSPNGGSAVTRNRMARLQSDGRLDRTLNLGISAVDPSGLYPVAAIAIQRDGRILIGGTFLNVLGVARNRIARLNTDGTLDTTFNPNANALVYTIVEQSDGKILIGGDFTTLAPNGGAPVTRNRIARLNPDGTLDSALDPNANDIVYSIALQADGNILLGGRFSSLSPNGGAAVTRNRMARLDPTGMLDPAFNPNAAGTEVSSIAVLPDTRILVSGAFSNIGGQPRAHLARLDATTGLADSFNANSNGRIHAMAVQADGKILVGGFFNFIGGASRPQLARLDATTGLADSFNPNPNNAVYSIVVQADGRIVAGGDFTQIGFQGRSKIARFEPDGALDPAFNPNADSQVSALALQTDGKVLAGGYFGNIGGQTRIFFARLINDTPALQILTVTQTAVTWTRSGASAQFGRVVFEESTDGVTYKALGEGTPLGSNWTLTGLNFAVGQSIYIRARGYNRSGFQNSSDSITETVRLAVIGLELATAVSRKTHGDGGDFDIPLPLSGEPGVECRSSGGAHTLVFTLNNDVVSGSASVTAGTGSVSGTPIFAGNTITVNLTGVADVQRISVTLSGVSDSLGQVLPATTISMNLLIGDSNGDKIVNVSDTLQTRGRAGQPTDAMNFRSDVNADGNVNVADTLVVRVRSGNFVP